MGAFYNGLDTWGPRVALIHGARVLSYAELADAGDEVAHRLGERRALVFLRASNDIESIAAYIGCLRGGHAVYLYGESDDEAKIARLIDGYAPDFVIRNGVVEAAAGRDDRPLHPDLRVLLSTSGSTGSPKLVKLSERNITSNAASIVEYLELTERDRAITALKFNYSYGMSVIHSHLACGASLLLSDESVASPAFWRGFVDGEATSFAGVPYSFELLAQSTEWAATPGLRYATQAGGRLAPDIVRQIGALSERNGWRFYVMYGQTEASPRMAYLPPERIATGADCIGVPIPGGAFALLGDDGQPVEGVGQPGELVYSGPNVMMGYAQQAPDLATDETPDGLRTGDIAERTGDGLFRIVGRTSRIVKPFGIRVSLDELQEQVRAIVPGAVCTGTDQRIVIAVPMAMDGDRRSELVGRLANQYRLPPFTFQLTIVDAIPLLPSGKIDYQAILALAATSQPDQRPANLPQKLVRTAQMLVMPQFYQRWMLEIGNILGLVKEEWEDVISIFRTFTSVVEIDGDSSFASLAGDSLSYVQTSLALEAYLGFLPDDWPARTVDQLEEARIVHQSV